MFSVLKLNMFVVDKCKKFTRHSLGLYLFHIVIQNFKSFYFYSLFVQTVVHFPVHSFLVSCILQKNYNFSSPHLYSTLRNGSRDGIKFFLLWNNQLWNNANNTTQQSFVTACERCSHEICLHYKMIFLKHF